MATLAERKQPLGTPLLESSTAEPLSSSAATATTLPSERLLGSLVQGDVRSVVLGLASSAIGGGLFTLPYAVAQMGLALGFMLLCVCCAVSAIATAVLATATLRLGVSSYGALATETLGRRWGILTDALISGNGAICVPLLLIFEFDFVTGVLRQVIGRDAPWLHLFSFRLFVLTAISALAVPLAVRKRYGALRQVTVPYVAVLLATAVAAAFRSPIYHTRVPKGGVRWWRPKSFGGVLANLNVFQFVFMHHQNVPAICHDLRNASDVWRVAFAAAGLELAIYTLVGISGYWALADATPQDFILGYDADDPLMLPCRVLLALALVFALPMCLISTAGAFRRLARRCMYTGRPPWGRARYRRGATVGGFLLVGLCWAALTTQAGVIVSTCGGVVATSLLAALPSMLAKKAGARYILATAAAIGYTSCIVAACNH